MEYSYNAKLQNDTAQENGSRGGADDNRSFQRRRRRVWLGEREWETDAVCRSIFGVYNIPWLLVFSLFVIYHVGLDDIWRHGEHSDGLQVLPGPGPHREVGQEAQHGRAVHSARGVWQGGGLWIASTCPFSTEGFRDENLHILPIAPFNVMSFIIEPCT